MMCTRLSWQACNYLQILTSKSALSRRVHTCVPHHENVTMKDVDKLQEFVDNSSSILVLTGAGISTESGIPDYRSEGVGLYARSNHRPVQYQEFMKSAAVRQRYWARNFVGWPIFSSFQPNTSHFVLAQWEQKGKISCLVTQNVDKLHHKAGSKNIIELHGSAYEVKCTNCDFRMSRHKFQDKLLEINPHVVGSPKVTNPDGDVELQQQSIITFKVPACVYCCDTEKGILKPDIVFFGDNVPKNRIDMINNALENSDSMLILGSSLQVYSGYRFVQRASELGIPIAIVNIGVTRGDKFAHVKFSVKCSDILSKLCI